jgi:hypothetical protein
MVLVGMAYSSIFTEKVQLLFANIISMFQFENKKTAKGLPQNAAAPF